MPLTASSLVELFGGSTSAAGVVVTEEKALGLPSILRAVKLRATVESSLPFKVYSAPSVEAPASAQARKLMDDPHPDLTPIELWTLIRCHRILWGNAYVLKLKNRLGQTEELWPVHPSRVKVGRDKATLRKWYLVDGEDVYTDDVMLHFPGFGYDGITGVSPIRLARNGIGLAIAAEESGGNFFANGMIATGILQTEQLLPNSIKQPACVWCYRRYPSGSCAEADHALL